MTDRLTATAAADAERILAAAARRILAERLAAGRGDGPPRARDTRRLTPAQSVSLPAISTSAEDTHPPTLADG